jgi:hypothetical protein
MARESRRARRLHGRRTCPACNGTGQVAGFVEIPTGRAKLQCSVCSGSGFADGSFSVSGSNADDVLRVMKELSQQRRELMTTSNAMKDSLRSPWVSGLFYLSCVLVVFTLLAVVANVVPLVALPAVAVVGVLLVTLVAAFQQRQDGRLSEQSFLKLALMTFRNLPLLVMRRGDARQSEESNTES